MCMTGNSAAGISAWPLQGAMREPLGLAAGVCVTMVTSQRHAGGNRWIFDRRRSIQPAILLRAERSVALMAVCRPTAEQMWAQNWTGTLDILQLLTLNVGRSVASRHSWFCSVRSGNCQDLLRALQLCTTSFTIWRRKVWVGRRHLMVFFCTGLLQLTLCILVQLVSFLRLKFRLLSSSTLFIYCEDGGGGGRPWGGLFFCY